MGTPLVLVTINSKCVVLNAFRHQRGGHREIELFVDPQKDVLNAFRHQRGGHLPPGVGIDPPSECSTPFGIREVGTDHRQALASMLSECSTPFGIREVGTSFHSCPVVDTAGSAQRLSASERWALLTAPSLVQIGQVLNAFRHQRGGHSLDHSSSDT